MARDYLCGPRYSSYDVRCGAGLTVVMEKRDPRRPFPFLVEVGKLLSGPVYRVPTTISEKSTYLAVCEACGEHSKPYKRKREPALKHWAMRHRCPPKKEEAPCP